MIKGSHWHESRGGRCKTEMERQLEFQSLHCGCVLWDRLDYSKNMKIPSYASVRHLKDIFMPAAWLALLPFSSPLPSFHMCAQHFSSLNRSEPYKIDLF